MTMVNKPRIQVLKTPILRVDPTMIIPLDI